MVYSARALPSDKKILCATRQEVFRVTMVPYTIYMDESFYEFWGLQNDQGNFCYAVFGLPDRHLRALDQFHAEFLRDFRAAVKSELNQDPPQELKSYLFRSLPFPVRRRLALRLREFMRQVDAFVLSDFTQVRGFVLEKIRSDVARKGEERLPIEWQVLYERRRQEILNQVAEGGAGQAPILQWLVGTITVGVAQFLVSRADEYKIYFDPRGPKEDYGVGTGILDFTKMTLQNMHREKPGRFMGISGEHRSEELPGLQFADLMVGEVRTWFVSNLDILKYASGPLLVTNASANAVFEHIGSLANPFSGESFNAKRQRVRKLPPGLARQLRVVDGKSALPYFRHFLAKGLLSCVAEWGEFRHIDFDRASVIDSIDDWETGLLV